MKFEDVKIIGNIGAGTMGHATAMQFAIAGYPVHMIDQNDAALQHGLDLIKADLKTLHEANYLTDEEVKQVLERISTFTSYKEGLKDADFIIESIVENLKIKQTVWTEVEVYVSDETILATNTSGLSPTEIQSVLKNKDRFLVAHFWNPAHLMPLVEIVPGKETSDSTIKLTYQLMKKIGKHPAALKKESLGFVGNRIQLAVIREALHIVEEGIADPQTVDDIVKYSLGRRWSILGPIMSADLGGLDVFNNISSYLLKDLDNDTEANKTLSENAKNGNLGMKTGKGYYDWDKEKTNYIVSERDKALLEDFLDDQKDN
ncbi:3-hydroxyacyl-CoA dehydrogenase family protein [Companilactobacillus mishanensis]|uniref:3-hydroxyacyl-CoA dehydrogenase family protein n=1 Tax=Companilactobacillus mishanensis TaxID=2486008 RepID=UPI000F776627|nr:3-hydroxyacyl-CoA dehydrogenase family protein [Companilactobacillus mishanensis]